MKRLTLTGIALFLVAVLNAQVEDDWLKKMKEEQNNTLKDFEQFKQQVYQEYESFRRQANEEYARFMEEAWKSFDIHPAEEPPAKPKPPTPLVDDTEPIPDPNSNTRPVRETVRVPDPVVISEIPRPDLTQTERPMPIEPVAPSTVPMIALQNIYLYSIYVWDNV